MDRICILCDKKAFAKAMCKFCYNEEYKKKNYKKLLKQNRERKREIRKTESGKEHMRKIHKKWYEKNKESYNFIRKEKYKNLDKNDLDKIKEKNKEYRKKNEDRERKRRKSYYKDNRKVILEKKRQYHKSAHGKLIRKLNDFKRDCKLRNSKFKLNKEEVKEIYERDKVCVYCGSSEKLTFDHIIPVNKDGKTIIGNIVVACQPCNSSKYNHNVFDWCDKNNINIPKIITECL